MGIRCRALPSSKRNIGACFHRLQHSSRSPLLAAVQLQFGSTPTLTRRTYSSSPKVEQDDERKWTLLYHRNPSKSKSPRMLFGVSTFNLVYWTWYVVDFTPSINASAQAKAALGQIDPELLEKMLVDPIMGYVGLGVSSLIWIGSYLYTKQLVSAIWGSQPTSDGEEMALAVSPLKFPFLSQPKILGRTVYDPENNDFDGVENIVFTESELKSESSVKVYAPGDLTLSEEQRKSDVIVKFNGEFSRLRGVVGLKEEDVDGEASGPLASLLQQKYLLEVGSGDEVMPNASPALLHSLVIKDHPMENFKRGGRHDSNKLGDTNAKVGKERKMRPKSKRPRPISQLEMARGTLEESIKNPVRK